MLLGMVIDDNGLVPSKDKKVFDNFGKMLKNLYSAKVASLNMQGLEKEFSFDSPLTFNHIILCENIVRGHSVFGFEVEYNFGGKWKKLYQGEVIGNKRIIKTKRITANALKIKITQSDGEVEFYDIGLYNVT